MEEITTVVPRPESNKYQAIHLTEGNLKKITAIFGDVTLTKTRKGPIVNIPHCGKGHLNRCFVVYHKNEIGMLTGMCFKKSKFAANWKALHPVYRDEVKHVTFTRGIDDGIGFDIATCITGSGATFNVCIPAHILLVRADLVGCTMAEACTKVSRLMSPNWKKRGVEYKTYEEPEWVW